MGHGLFHEIPAALEVPLTKSEADDLTAKATLAQLLALTARSRLFSLSTKLRAICGALVKGNRYRFHIGTTL